MLDGITDSCVDTFCHGHINTNRDVILSPNTCKYQRCDGSEGFESIKCVYPAQKVESINDIVITAQFALNLTFKGPCIANVFSSITNRMQCYTIRLFLQNALHVSGGSSAHHQELKLYIQHQVFVKLLLLPFAIVEELEQLDKYPMLYVQFELLMMGGGTA
jgi:hypothetical protein